MGERKKSFRKGMELVHKEKKEKILFGSWNTDGTATCLTASKSFIKLSRTELEQDYISYSEIEKKAKEKRKGQCW